MAQSSQLPLRPTPYPLASSPASLVSLHQGRRAPSTGKKAPTCSSQRRLQKAPPYRHSADAEGAYIQTRADAERALQTRADTEGAYIQTRAKGRLPLRVCTTSSTEVPLHSALTAFEGLLWFSIQANALQKPSEVSYLVNKLKYENNIQFGNLSCNP